MRVAACLSDNFLLSLSSLPETQRQFIIAISTCKDEDLLGHLRPFKGWMWERQGDVSAWAPALNRFDDLLNAYAVHTGLAPEAAASQPPPSFVPCEALVVAILETSYIVLENCSSKFLYASVDVVTALLESFCLPIVCGAIQLLAVCYGFIRRNRRNALPRDCPDFGNRLSLFCFRPVAYDAFVLQRQPQLAAARTARHSPSPPPLPRLSSSSSGSRSSSRGSGGPGDGAGMAVEGDAAAATAAAAAGNSETAANRLDLLSFCLADELPSDIDGFFELQWSVPAAAAAAAAADRRGSGCSDAMMVDHPSDSSSSKQQPQQLQQPQAARTVRLFCSELLLPGFSRRTVPHLDGTASSCCTSTAAAAASCSSGTTSSTPDCCSSSSRDCTACGALEAHCQAIIRKYNIPPQHHPAVRHRMRLLHGLRCPAYRGGLVDVYLCSLSCLMIVSPAQFSQMLQQQPLLLPEFAALLKHAERISSRTLLLAADLLSLLLEDKTLYRQTAGLVGVFSPYGLFLSLLRRLLANPFADRPFRVSRIHTAVSSRASRSSSKCRCCQQQQQQPVIEYVVVEAADEAELRSWEQRVAKPGALRQLENDLNRMQTLMHLLAAYSAIVGTTHSVIHAFVQPSLLKALIGFLRHRDPLLVPVQMIVLRTLEAHVEQQHSSSSTSNNSQLLQFIQEELQLPERLQERMLYDAACMQQRVKDMQQYERWVESCSCCRNSSSSGSGSGSSELAVDGGEKPSVAAPESSSSSYSPICCSSYAGIDWTERWVYPRDGSDDERLLYWLKACEVETRRCVLKTATKQFYFLAANHKANPPFFRDMLAPRAPLSVLCSDIIGNPEHFGVGCVASFFSVITDAVSDAPRHATAIAQLPVVSLLLASLHASYLRIYLQQHQQQQLQLQMQREGRDKEERQGPGEGVSPQFHHQQPLLMLCEQQDMHLLLRRQQLAQQCVLLHEGTLNALGAFITALASHTAGLRVLRQDKVTELVDSELQKLQQPNKQETEQQQQQQQQQHQGQSQEGAAPDGEQQTPSAAAPSGPSGQQHQSPVAATDQVAEPAGRDPAATSAAETTAAATAAEAAPAAATAAATGGEELSQMEVCGTHPQNEGAAVATSAAATGPPPAARAAAEATGPPQGEAGAVQAEKDALLLLRRHLQLQQEDLLSFQGALQHPDGRFSPWAACSLLVHAAASADVVLLDRFGEAAAGLGTALDEVLGAIANSSTSTSESLGGTEARDALVRQTLLLLQQLIVAAKKLEPWKPVSPARAAEETRQKAKQRPMDVSDLELRGSSSEWLLDRLANAGRFLSAFLASTETQRSFVSRGGIVLLLQLCDSSCLPPGLLHLFPQHPLVHVLRHAAPYDSTLQQQAVQQLLLDRGLFALQRLLTLKQRWQEQGFWPCRVPVPEAAAAVAAAAAAAGLQQLPQLLSTMPEPLRSIPRNERKELVFALHACCNAITLMLSLHREFCQAYGTTPSRATPPFAQQQHVHQLLLLNLSHLLLLLQPLLPWLLQLLYACAVPADGENPSLLNQKHNSHEHPSVRASRLLHEEQQQQQQQSKLATAAAAADQPLSNNDMLWSSLGEFAYSSPPPLPAGCSSRSSSSSSTSSTSDNNNASSGASAEASSAAAASSSDSSSSDGIRNAVGSGAKFISDEAADSPVVLQELLRAACLTFRNFLCMVSRQINGGGLRRKSPQQRQIASAHLFLIADTARGFLDCIPSVPLPVAPLLHALPAVTAAAGSSCSSAQQLVEPEAAAAAVDAARAAAVAAPSSAAEMEVDSGVSSNSSSSSKFSIQGLSMAQSLSYLSDVCDILYKLHVDEKSKGVLMTLSFDLFHKVGGFSAFLRAFHYSAACNVAVCALLATRVCSCCNPMAQQQQQPDQQQMHQQQQQQQQAETEAFEAIKPCTHLTIRQMLPASLFAAIVPNQDPKQQQKQQQEAEERQAVFIQWVEEAAAHIAADCLSISQLVYLRNVAARQLQSCLTYLDRVTSWKRCMNSAFTAQAVRYYPRPSYFEPMEDDGQQVSAPAAAGEAAAPLPDGFVGAGADLDMGSSSSNSGSSSSSSTKDESSSSSSSSSSSKLMTYSTSLETLSVAYSELHYLCWADRGQLSSVWTSAGAAAAGETEEQQQKQQRLQELLLQIIVHPDIACIDAVGMLRSVGCEAAAHTYVWWVFVARCGAPLTERQVQQHFPLHKHSGGAAAAAPDAAPASPAALPGNPGEAVGAAALEPLPAGARGRGSASAGAAKRAGSRRRGQQQQQQQLQQQEAGAPVGTPGRESDNCSDEASRQLHVLIAPSLQRTILFFPRIFFHLLDTQTPQRRQQLRRVYAHTVEAVGTAQQQRMLVPGGGSAAAIQQQQQQQLLLLHQQVEQLVEMGFSRADARRAIESSGGRGVEAAMDFLLDMQRRDVASGEEQQQQDSSTGGTPRGDEAAATAPAAPAAPPEASPAAAGQQDSSSSSSANPGGDPAPTEPAAAPPAEAQAAEAPAETPATPTAPPSAAATAAAEASPSNAEAAGTAAGGGASEGSRAVSPLAAAAETLYGAIHATPPQQLPSGVMRAALSAASAAAVALPLSQPSLQLAGDGEIRWTCGLLRDQLQQEAVWGTPPQPLLQALLSIASSNSELATRHMQESSSSISSSSNNTCTVGASTAALVNAFAVVTGQPETQEPWMDQQQQQQQQQEEQPHQQQEQQNAEAAKPPEPTELELLLRYADEEMGRQLPPQQQQQDKTIDEPQQAQQQQRDVKRPPQLQRVLHGHFSDAFALSLGALLRQRLLEDLISSACVSPLGVPGLCEVFLKLICSSCDLRPQPLQQQQQQQKEGAADAETAAQGEAAASAGAEEDGGQMAAPPTEQLYPWEVESSSSSSNRGTRQLTSVEKNTAAAVYMLVLRLAYLRAAVQHLVKADPTLMGCRVPSAAVAAGTGAAPAAAARQSDLQRAIGVHVCMRAQQQLYCCSFFMAHLLHRRFCWKSMLQQCAEAAAAACEPGSAAAAAAAAAAAHPMSLFSSLICTYASANVHTASAAAAAGQPLLTDVKGWFQYPEMLDSCEAGAAAAAGAGTVKASALLPLPGWCLLSYPATGTMAIQELRVAAAVPKYGLLRLIPVDGVEAQREQLQQQQQGAAAATGTIITDRPSGLNAPAASYLAAFVLPSLLCMEEMMHMYLLQDTAAAHDAQQHETGTSSSTGSSCSNAAADSLTSAVGASIGAVNNSSSSSSSSSSLAPPAVTGSNQRGVTPSRATRSALGSTSSTSNGSDSSNSSSSSSNEAAPGGAVGDVGFDELLRSFTAAEQRQVVASCLDLLLVFPAADGDTVLAMLQLLRRLTSIYSNALMLLLHQPKGRYRAAPVTSQQQQLPLQHHHHQHHHHQQQQLQQPLGWGLGVLLRLPRTASCSGLVSLLCAIITNVLEEPSLIAACVERGLRVAFAASSRMAHQTHLRVHGNSPTEETPAPLLPVESVLKSLGPLLSRNPSLVEQVLSYCCSIHRQVLQPEDPQQQQQQKQQQEGQAGAGGGLPEGTSAPAADCQEQARDTSAATASTRTGRAAADDGCSTAAMAEDGPATAAGAQEDGSSSSSNSSSSNDTSSIVPRQFYPSSIFVGPKAGYLFGRGSKGLGYYYCSSNSGDSSSNVNGSSANDGRTWCCSDKSFQEVLLLGWLTEEKRQQQQQQQQPQQQQLQRRVRRLLQAATKPPVVGPVVLSVLLDHLVLLLSVHAWTVPAPLPKPSQQEEQQQQQQQQREWRQMCEVEEGLHSHTQKPVFPFIVTADRLLYILTQLVSLFPHMLPLLLKPISLAFPAALSHAQDSSSSSSSAAAAAVQVGGRSAGRTRLKQQQGQQQANGVKMETAAGPKQQQQHLLHLEPRLYMKEPFPWPFVSSCPELLRCCGSDVRLLLQHGTKDQQQQQHQSCGGPPRMSVVDVLVHEVLPRLLSISLAGSSQASSQQLQQQLQQQQQQQRKAAAGMLQQFSNLLAAMGSSNAEMRLVLIRHVVTLLRVARGRAAAAAATAGDPGSSSTSMTAEALEALKGKDLLDISVVSVLAGLLQRLLAATPPVPPAHAQQQNSKVPAAAADATAGCSDTTRPPNNPRPDGDGGDVGGADCPGSAQQEQQSSSSSSNSSSSNSSSSNSNSSSSSGGANGSSSGNSGTSSSGNSGTSSSASRTRSSGGAQGTASSGSSSSSSSSASSGGDDGDDGERPNSKNSGRPSDLLEGTDLQQQQTARAVQCLSPKEQRQLRELLAGLLLQLSLQAEDSHAVATSIIRCLLHLTSPPAAQLPGLETGKQQQPQQQQHSGTGHVSPPGSVGSGGDPAAAAAAAAAADAAEREEEESDEGDEDEADLDEMDEDDEEGDLELVLEEDSSSSSSSSSSSELDDDDEQQQQEDDEAAAAARGALAAGEADEADGGSLSAAAAAAEEAAAAADADNDHEPEDDEEDDDEDNDDDDEDGFAELSVLDGLGDEDDEESQDDEEYGENSEDEESEGAVAGRGAFLGSGRLPHEIDLESEGGRALQLAGEDGQLLGHAEGPEGLDEDEDEDEDEDDEDDDDDAPRIRERGEIDYLAGPEEEDLDGADIVDGLHPLGSGASQGPLLAHAFLEETVVPRDPPPPPPAAQGPAAAAGGAAQQQQDLPPPPAALPAAGAAAGAASASGPRDGAPMEADEQQNPQQQQQQQPAGSSAVDPSAAGAMAAENLDQQQLQQQGTSLSSSAPASSAGAAPAAAAPGASGLAAQAAGAAAGAPGAATQRRGHRGTGSSSHSSSSSSGMRSRGTSGPWRAAGEGRGGRSAFAGLDRGVLGLLEDEEEELESESQEEAAAAAPAAAAVTAESVNIISSALQREPRGAFRLQIDFGGLAGADDAAVIRSVLQEAEERGITIAPLTSGHTGGGSRRAGAAAAAAPAAAAAAAAGINGDDLMGQAPQSPPDADLLPPSEHPLFLQCPRPSPAAVSHHHSGSSSSSSSNPFALFSSNGGSNVITTAGAANLGDRLLDTLFEDIAGGLFRPAAARRHGQQPRVLQQQLQQIRQSREQEAAAAAAVAAAAAGGRQQQQPVGDMSSAVSVPTSAAATMAAAATAAQHMLSTFVVDRLGTRNINRIEVDPAPLQACPSPQTSAPAEAATAGTEAAAAPADGAAATAAAAEGTPSTSVQAEGVSPHAAEDAAAERPAASADGEAIVLDQPAEGSAAAAAAAEVAAAETLATEETPLTQQLQQQQQGQQQQQQQEQQQQQDQQQQQGSQNQSPTPNTAATSGTEPPAANSAAAAAQREAAEGTAEAAPAEPEPAAAAAPAATAAPAAATADGDSMDVDTGDATQRATSSSSSSSNDSGNNSSSNNDSSNNDSSSGEPSLASLACALGLTEASLLEAAGVDPSFLEALPADLRQEILQQQLRLLTIEAVEMRRAAARPAAAAPAAAAAGSEGTASAATDAGPDQPPPAAVGTVPDSTQATPAATAASPAAEASGDGAQQQGADAEAAAPASAAGSEPATAAASPEGAATAGEEQRPRLRDLPVDLLNALPAAVRQAAVAGCRDRDSVEEGAAAPGADVDNATFLATLEPALRQEVLLTADALVLEALPRELQVEAALLRERAMQRQQQRQQQQQRAAAAAAAAAANITAGAAGGAPPAGDRPGRGSRGTSSGPGGASGSGGPSLPAAFVDASLALFGGFEGRWGPLGGPHSSTGARLLGMPASSLLPRSIRLGLREALLDDAVFSREGEGPRGAAAGGDAAASLIAARGMLQSSAAARSAAAGGPASGAAAAAAAARGPVFAGMPEELLLLPSERLLRAPAALSAPPGLTGFSGLSGLVAFPNRTGGGTRFRVSQGAGGLAGSLGSAAEAAGGAFRQIDFLSLLLNGGAAAVATNGAAAAAPQALSEDLWVGFLTAAAGGGGGPHGGPWSGGGGPPGGPHRGPGRSSGGANGGPPFDSSPLSIPGLMGVCRVLFLSRGVNKRLLFLLLASLAASHAETRDVLLLLLVYICWVAIPECYTTLRPSYPGRDTLKLLGLPPVPVLLPPEGSQQQQQQQHQQQQQQGGFQCERFAMGGAAAERVLEQLRSLLTVLPQAAATFCTKMPHPRSLTFQDLLKVQQRRHNASSSSSSSHHSPQQQQGEAKSEGAPPAATAQRTEQQQQQPQQQQHHHEGAAEGGEDLAHELRRKKKRREPCSSTGTSKDEGAAASVLQQQNEPLEEPVDGEYLINVLMQLTATSLFQTSPRHMAHLLAAIHLLVSGSASSSSSSSNSSSRSRPPSRSSAPASSSRAQSTDSQGQPSSSSSSSAAAPGSSSSASAAVPSSGSSTAAVAPGSSSGNSAEPAVEEIVPDNALSSSSSSSNSSSSSAQESMQERMLRVVTPEAVECICGLLCSPHVAAAWSQVVGFSAQQREAQLQQLAVVAKIVGCLYTSAQHRGWVDEALRRNCDALSDVLSQELAALSRTLNEAAQQQQQLQVHDDLWARREALEPHFAAFYRLCGTLNEVYTHLQQQQQQQLQQQQAKSPDAAAGSATEEPAGAASAAAPQAAAVPAVAGAAANQVPPPAASLNADIDLSSAPEAPAAAAAPPAAAAAGAAAAANADESSTAVVPALVRFRAFFDASKVHKIWEGLEDVLSAVGAAYPALSAEAAATQHRHRTQQAAAAAAAAEATAASAAAAAGSAGAASGAATARPAGTDAAAGEARAREAAGGEAAADGAAAAAAAEDGEGAVVEEREAAAAGSRELAAPLVLAQLLPLFEAFLQVQQLSIAADLGLKDVSMLQELDLFAAAAERERSIADRAAAAVAAAVDPRTGIPDAAAAQAACCRASEELLQCEKQEEDGGGFGVSSRRHLALCCFCERHVLCFNALLKQNPSLLSGPFSPLLRLTPMMLSFENKRHYFRQKIKEIRHASRADHVRLSVRRQHVFTDSYHQIRIRSGEEMKGKLNVVFHGEEGLDGGGLTREWFGLLARDMFNPNYALFTREGAKSEFNQPNPLSAINPEHLYYFKFIGRVIGKALFDGHYLPAYFCRSFYKHMLNKKCSMRDAESLDPSLYSNLQKILEYPLEDLALTDLTFSVETDEFGKHKVNDLLPGGRHVPVTDANKALYVQLMCQRKIAGGIQKQLEAFLSGFHELIPPSLISIFDDKELELLLSGLPTINVADLQENTEYVNYLPTEQPILWFWEIMEEFDTPQKAAFLQFVTGTSRVPIGGFRNLVGMRGPQKFSIQKAYGENRLPSAHTCFNQLDLPAYTSKAILKKKLLLAITEGREGFGFV